MEKLRLTRDEAYTDAQIMLNVYNASARESNHVDGFNYFASRAAELRAHITATSNAMLFENFEHLCEILDEIEVGDPFDDIDEKELLRYQSSLLNDLESPHIEDAIPALRYVDSERAAAFAQEFGKHPSLTGLV